MHISMQVHAAPYIQANMRTYSPCHAVHARNRSDDYSTHTHTDARTQTRARAHCESPGRASFHSARPVILRLKEFAVDYFWTEAGSFGKERPGHFEDLTGSSRRCLPKSPRVAAPPPAAHTYMHAISSSSASRIRLIHSVSWSHCFCHILGRNTLFRTDRMW